MAVSPHLEEDDILKPEADETATPENHDAIGVELHDTTHDELDEYLRTDIMIPRSVELVSARVLKCSQDGDGNLTGCRHNNSVLDTR
jgi:hypothetical protein